MADNVSISGDVVAADDIGGAKFQRIKLVHGADGVNDGDVATGNPLPTTLVPNADGYRVFIPSQAVGANKVFFDLFNAVGSGRILKIKSVRAIKNGSVAVTGTLAVQLFLTKTSAVGTGGTAATRNGSALNAMTISDMDSTTPALPAEISGRLTPTGGATAAAVISERQVFTEETNASGYDHPEFLNPGLLDVKALFIREGEGIRVVQGSVASVGNIGFEIVFEAE